MVACRYDAGAERVDGDGVSETERLLPWTTWTWLSGRRHDSLTHHVNFVTNVQDGPKSDTPLVFEFPVLLDACAIFGSSRINFIKW